MEKSSYRKFPYNENYILEMAQNVPENRCNKSYRILGKAYSVIFLLKKKKKIGRAQTRVLRIFTFFISPASGYRKRKKKQQQQQQQHTGHVPHA